MLRRLLVAALVFLVIVVVAADRLGAIIAAHVVAGKVRTDEGLINRPSVSIAGIPFLTQAFRGEYNDVTIKAADFPVSGVAVTSMTAHLHGVHISAHDAINNTVSKVPVDHVSATAFVSFPNINAYLAGVSPRGQQVSLRAAGADSFTVSDRLRVLGQEVALQGDGSLVLSGNVIAIAVTDLRAGSGPAVSSELLRQVLGELRIKIPLRSMPFRVDLQSVKVSSSGVTVSGTAEDVVLGTKPSR
jgi:hypothetical protein